MRRWVVVVGALAAVGAASGGGAYLALTGDDGYGRHEGTIAGDGDFGRHELSIPASSVVVVEVTPSADLDATVGFTLRDAEADERYADLFEPIADELLADDGRWFAFDVGFAGDAERTLIVAPAGVTGSVVVGSAEETAGDYSINLTRFELGVDATADLDRVLRAVARSDDVPDDLRDFYDLLVTQAEEGS